MAASLGRAAVVALATPPLAARPHLGCDEPTAAALPAADAGARTPRVANACLEEPDAGNLHVRIRGGPGKATTQGYPTVLRGAPLLPGGVEQRVLLGAGELHVNRT